MQKKKSCVTKTLNSYTGVIEMNIERVCSDVNELVDDLVEAIHYEILEEATTRQFREKSVFFIFLCPGL